MAEPPLDAERILESLAEHAVDYVVIGGVAAQTYGRMRMTSDVDLIPAPDPANLERLAAALRELGARPLNPGQAETEINAEMLPRATIWQFTTRAGGIDVLHEVPGGREFDDLRRDALAIQLGQTQVQVVSLDDLLRMKTARGRQVDLEDVAALTDGADAPKGEGE